MNRDEIIRWLQENDSERLDELWQRADETRAAQVGPAVHLRGLIELSNICRRRCAYCGIHTGNDRITRYRMSTDEILACAEEAVRFGYGTVVLQAGEDPALGGEAVARLVRLIKARTPLAVTLSLGEREDAEYELWREAGADRYLLRFETSDPDLYRLIHPPLGTDAPDRFALLRRLKKLGYETGSGVMVGVPGQRYETLARDIECFRELDLDMIGVGPYIPHPDTQLGRGEVAPDAGPEQVPGSELMTYKVVALARLVCPWANIPSTTALATINKESGRELGLQRGANIVMPNLTPPRYRELYEIYPEKACVNETAEQCRMCLRGRIESIGRVLGSGRGDCVRRLRDA